MKKIVFIINPISGTGRYKIVEKAIENHLDKTKFDYSIRYTEYKGHATEIAIEESQKGTQYIISVGGDGTLNEVVKGMVNSNSILGLIATGSGNGLARHLNISTNPAKAIEVINNEKVEKIDTVTLNEHRFVSIAGVGFDAFVARKFARSEKRGFFTYFKLTIRSFFNYKPKNYTLKFDNNKIKRRAFFITFANSSQWGYNKKISPSASLTDGLVDVCIFKKPSVIHTILLMPFLFANKIDKTSQLDVIKTNEIIISRKKDKKMHIHIDGDDSKRRNTVHVKVDPLSLSVLIP